MKRLHRTQLLCVPRMLGNGVHFLVMNKTVSDSLAKWAVSQSWLHQWDKHRDWEYLWIDACIYIHVWVCRNLPSGAAGLLRSILAHTTPFASPGRVPERNHVYYGSHLLTKIGAVAHLKTAATIVKAARAFPFKLPRFICSKILASRLQFSRHSPYLRVEIWGKFRETQLSRCWGPREWIQE